ncbi:hypothetical protein ABT187_43260 [Streptomyces sp. NPDC001817]
MAVRDGLCPSGLGFWDVAVVEVASAKLGLGRGVVVGGRGGVCC